LFEASKVDLQDKPEWFKSLYAKANPVPGSAAKVPILEVVFPHSSTQVLCESLVLVEYIAEVYGTNSILPPTPLQRAHARLFSELCSPAFSYLPLLRARGDEAKTEAALHELKRALSGAEKFLCVNGDSSGPFLFGERFSTAECTLAPFVQRACINLPHFMGKAYDPLFIAEAEGYSKLASWMRAVIERPSVKSTAVAPEESLTSVEMMLKRFADADAAAAARK
jgi:glutathione S-transferase